MSFRFARLSLVLLTLPPLVGAEVSARGVAGHSEAPAASHRRHDPFRGATQTAANRLSIVSAHDGAIEQQRIAAGNAHAPVAPDASSSFELRHGGFVCADATSQVLFANSTISAMLNAYQLWAMSAVPERGTGTTLAGLATLVGAGLFRRRDKAPAQRD